MVPVRIRDLLLFLAPLVYLSPQISFKDILLSPPIIIFYLYILYTAINSLILSNSLGFLYSLRLVEYSLFYFLGIALFLFNCNLKTSVTIFLIAGFITLALYSTDDTIWSTTTRITLTMIGPYNVAVVYAMLFSLPISLTSRAASFVFVIVSGSRMMLLSTVFYTLIVSFFKNKGEKRRYFVYATVALLFIFSFLVSQLGDSRLVKGVSKTVNTIEKVMDESQIRKTATNQYEYHRLFHSRGDGILGMEDGKEYDHSLYLRFVTWSDVLKMSTQSFEKFFFGYGAGFHRSATDGSLFLLLGEGGAIAIIIFTLFIVSCYLLLRKFDAHGAVLMFIFSGLMIDTFYSSFALPLLLLLSGYYSMHKT